MGETETLSNLQMLIDSLRPSPAPVDRQLWDSLDVARYLRRSQQVTVERIVCMPDFPAGIRIGGNSRPLWKAAEVMAWAESQTEKTGRPRKFIA